MVYCATAVAAAVIVNPRDCCPGVCAAPSTVHCQKAYNPAGSVAGATRFTLVFSGTLATV